MQQKLTHLNHSLLNDFNYLKPSLALLDDSWRKFLLANCYSELQDIDRTLVTVAKNKTIYPAPELIFNALRLTPLSAIKVVILGQDPYHGDGEANGLAFAINPGIKLPPSLRNIYKEIALEYNVAMEVDGGHLLKLATHGVLLLNSSLTVIKDQAGSLCTIGWHRVTNALISYINQSCAGVAFMLWGNHARQKASLIDELRHKILFAPHPSPLSVYRGFYGCNHFIAANEYLHSIGKTPINWISLLPVCMPS